MKQELSQTIYLKDYQPPAFLVDQLELFFELDPVVTRVTAKQRLYRNPAVTGEVQLILQGEQLELESVTINQTVLPPAAYVVDADTLTLKVVPDSAFTLEIVTRIHPEANTALEGLYVSKGLFCTQCEAQGFRRITYFQDRPDVMARYAVTLVADKTAYPVLLSNGNPVAQGELVNNRHWVRWEDPYKKPCYLFALVAGQLAVLEDRFVTASGREVLLQIYVEAHDLDKCDHAMRSLQHSMQWDEQRFGCEYDLDRYMIVAVSHFNMGAMENKGLNVFNTKFVLARPDTATDFDYEHIEAVIGHEYFHNWSGNRITCRDWFQLSLKEGFTVYRDQEFTADRTSRHVKRIHDVNMLRTRQFAEDSGPLAHPVRPDAYMEINNFYTVTIYEKGAEVVRMIASLLGRETFRAGTDLYFSRYDGQAVTCDDFVLCMEEVSGLDLSQFRRWYSQAGTPELAVSSDYDAGAGELTLTVAQSTPATPGQSEKLPLHIPLALGFLDADGHDLPVVLSGESPVGRAPGTRVLDVRQAVETFRFEQLKAPPVLSVLRGFSAPVRLRQTQTEQEQAFLFKHDSDGFNRWNAGQSLAASWLLQRIEDLEKSGDTAQTADPEILFDSFEHVLSLETADLSYQSLLLSLPSEEYLSSLLAVVDPVRVSKALLELRQLLAARFADVWLAVYRQHHREESGDLGAGAMGRRRLKNTCLGYLSLLESAEMQALVLAQFDAATTMTDQIAAFGALVNSAHPARQTAIDQFYAQWRGEDLVVDKWFALQAGCRLPGTLKQVEALLQHADFDLRTPNRVRSLIGAFSQGNPAQFHAADGSGYAFLAQQVQVLDAINPQVAARMLSPLSSWRRYDAGRQVLMQHALQHVAAREGISRDVFEVASKSLA